MPRVGFKLRWAIPVLARFSTRSKIAVPVVSEPVPAVVGTAINGASFAVMGFPRPIWVVSGLIREVDRVAIYQAARLRSRGSQPLRTRSVMKHVHTHKRSYQERWYTSSST